jgi:hypothetical protein
MATIQNIPYQPSAPYKAVAGYESKYIVTETGFIYDINWRGCGYTKPLCHLIAGTTGYVKVSLAQPDNTRKLVSVHRIVAQAFIPPVEGKPDVNHKDLDKTNNHKDNLEWIEHGDNIHHARTFLGNWSIKNHPSTIQPYIAYKYIDNVPNKGNFLNFTSLNQAAAHFQKPYHTFASVVAKAIKRQGYAYGYLWEKS